MSRVVQVKEYEIDDADLVVAGGLIFRGLSRPAFESWELNVPRVQPQPGTRVFPSDGVSETRCSPTKGAGVFRG